MKKMKISGNGGSICVTAAGYERQDADNFSDANWLSCLVEIDVPPFFGKYEATLSTEDFSSFAEGLRSLSDSLDGEALFETDEGAIIFRISALSLGTIRITGEAKFSGGVKCCLSFTFDADQTYLNEYLRAVADVLTQYPVRAIRNS